MCHNTRNCIVTERTGLARLDEACHDTLDCIVTGGAGRAEGIVSQYIKCIVTRGAGGKVDVSRPRPRHGQPGARHSTCDTTARPATQPAGGHDKALGAATIRPRARSLSAACARRLGCGCTLCTWHVFGLSTVSESLFGPLFMNAVHKIFSKKKLK